MSFQAHRGQAEASNEDAESPGAQCLPPPILGSTEKAPPSREGHGSMPPPGCIELE